MLEYKIGNLFDLIPYEQTGAKFICHVCNDIGVIGGGFTAPLLKKWPEVGRIYKEAPCHTLGTNQFVKVANDPIWVVNMIAQHEIISMNPKPIRYAALAKCMAEVKDVANGHFSEIWAPMFGSALAGGNWDFIEELINEIWKDLKVTVCKLEE
ncbi:MAG: Appr-1-p processing protein [Crenarchaeota archaeon]|nr:MAG: Appr-1-p processing protein [Thermoproteota archaeon]